MTTPLQFSLVHSTSTEKINIFFVKKQNPNQPYNVNLVSSTLPHQAYAEADYKNARFNGLKKDVNPNWAEKMIAEEPVIVSHKRVVSCDGGGGALGHPKVRYQSSVCVSSRLCTSSLPIFPHMHTHARTHAHARTRTRLVLICLPVGRCALTCLASEMCG